MKKILVAGVVLFGMNSAVNAAILAGGAMYGGPGQATAVCYLYNAGATAVTISSKTISREFNVPLGLTVDNCGAALSAGRSCGFATPIVNFAAHFCKVVVSSKANLRGVFEMRDAAGNVTSNIELH